jgi:hypothetical protein
MPTLETFRLDADSLVNFSADTETREARLLVTGSYPEKNLTVTEADLDALVAHFSHPVPVKVEHIDSPLDPLGIVESVRRQGSELLGTLRFPKTIAAFLSSRGAAKLSVGLLKQPKWQLLEASLTLSPHVPSATLLSANSLLSDPGGDKSELVQLRQEADFIRQQLRQQTIDQQIRELKRAGKVIPASEAQARQLLAADAAVTLSDGSEASSAAVFYRFLQAQPAVIPLSERAKVRFSGGVSGAAALAAEDEDEFSDDDLEVMKRLGVDPSDVRKTMQAEKAKQN